MEADMGGTEIFHPFKAIYSQPPKAGYARQVSISTDLFGLWEMSVGWPLKYEDAQLP